MELEEQEKAALISDIEADARLEAERLIKEAEARAADKRKYADKQAESLLNDAAQKAQEQAETIRRKALSEAELEVRRRSMHLQATIVQDVMDRVEQRLGEMVSGADYRSALLNWIVEAGIGLGAEAAEVNASEKERALIDDRLLAEATAKIQTLAGGPVTLTLSEAVPLPFQGVILTAADGRTAFNNQVKTRILRNQRTIQMLIHDSLFAENREEQV